MGVKGLTSFINRHSDFFQKCHLSNSEVIIDGSGLVYFLYFNIDSGHYGGEYLDFSKKLKQFFGNFQKCNIKPFVILDGVYDVAGLKDETRKAKQQQRMQSVVSVINGGKEKIMPPMGEHQFQYVLSEIGVQFAYSNFEADLDIAALANKRKCPVLAADSDYFIMNIHNGYIPFDKLDWEHILEEEDGGQLYLACQKFNIESFSSHYDVKPDILPLFASLIGNDYVPFHSLEKLILALKSKSESKSEKEIPSEMSQFRSRAQARLVSLLKSFQVFKGVNLTDALEEVTQHITSTGSEDLIKKLRSSCDMYDLAKSPSHLEDYFAASKAPANNVLVKNGVPQWCVDLHMQGKFPSICLDVLLKKFHKITIQVEDVSKRSINQCSLKLRRILYGLMLDESAGNVTVYERIDSALHQTEEQPIHHLEMCKNFPRFSELKDIKKEDVTHFFFTVMETNSAALDHYTPSLHLALLATRFWLKYADVNKSHVISLLICWIWGVAQMVEDGTKLDSNMKQDLVRAVFGKEAIPSKEAQQICQNFKSKDLIGRETKLDLEGIHGFSQWQSCIRYSSFLNSVLGRPFPECDLAILYNGRLLNNLFSCHRNAPSPRDDWIQQTIFKNAPASFKLFKTLKEYVYKKSDVQLAKDVYTEEPMHGKRKRNRDSNSDDDEEVAQKKLFTSSKRE